MDIVFTSVESGYVIDSDTGQLGEYSTCYTVVMQYTDRNDIQSIAEYVTAYLLISGLSESEIKATISQDEYWQFSISVPYSITLAERSKFSPELLRACYGYYVLGQESNLYNVATNRKTLLDSAIID